MKAKRTTYFAWIFVTMAILFLAPMPAISQDHGSGHGGGGGGGCGDIFGDLIHILRDDTTGQPILAQRWVEMPADIKGYGWGYCPIAVSGEGEDQEEIPFMPFSCDVDPAYLDLVEEANYFGRLNGGRTKERNNRMHFDEVISNIKAADYVKRSPEGRMMMGFDCSDIGQPPCTEWMTVDSPMESMGLLVRVMKYGHIAADPYEEDAWAHGDPKLSTQFHPALGEEDWPKFHKSLRNLLPDNGKNPGNCWDYDYEPQEFDIVNDANGDGVWTPAEPFYDRDGNGVRDEHEPFTDLEPLNGVWDEAEVFDDYNGNGVADEFVFLCADPESLGNTDFISGSILLAAAASKTGYVTVDLISYFGRIMKFTKKTEHTEATPDTLPALYRDCWASGDDPFPPDEEPTGDIVYDSCIIEEADIPMILEDDQWVFDCANGTPNHCAFPDLQERFVDFSGLNDYERENEQVDVIPDKTPGVWTLSTNQSLQSWIEIPNGTGYAQENIDGFVAATNDVIRMIEYVHNYDIPEDLYCKYDSSFCL